MKITTLVAMGFPVLVAAVLPWMMPRQAWWMALLAVGVFFLAFGIPSLFCVRGYAIRRGDLWIRRLFWETRLPLEGLVRAWADPEAMRGVLRKAGNGGLFAYTGWFQSGKLGRFQAWVTDPKRAVVLEFEDKKFMISPDRPKRFLRVLGYGNTGGPANR